MCKVKKEPTLRGHDCPYCFLPVMGLRNTKVYCGDDCRWGYHKRKNKQYKSRKKSLSQFSGKNLEIMESSIGTNSNCLRIDLQKLRKKGFRKSLYEKAIKRNGKQIFVIKEYEFYVKDDIVHILRTADVKDFELGVEERWQIEFPVMDNKKRVDFNSEEEYKTYYLDLISTVGYYRENIAS